MGQLNVNPADLVKAAGDYSDLSALTAQLSPKVAAEIQAIAASHGPMGHPIAVAIATGLSSQDKAVQSQGAQFAQHSERFTGHAATYTDADRAGAAKFDAITFPQVHVEPKPKPKHDHIPPVTCWLPSPDADPAKYCPAETTRIQYVDKDGNWIQKDIGTGANQRILNGEIPGVQYLPGPPTEPAPPGVTDRLWPDEDGNLVLQHEGNPPTIAKMPPGRISW